MEFVELVRKNRSYRGYNENRPVTREELTRLVECARLGCACGAAAVEQVGAFGAVRSRAAAEEKLAGRM